MASAASCRRPLRSLVLVPRRSVASLCDSRAPGRVQDLNLTPERRKVVADELARAVLPELLGPAKTLFRSAAAHSGGITA